MFSIFNEQHCVKFIIILYVWKYDVLNLCCTTFKGGFVVLRMKDGLQAPVWVEGGGGRTSVPSGIAIRFCYIITWTGICPWVYFKRVSCIWSYTIFVRIYLHILLVCNLQCETMTNWLLKGQVWHLVSCYDVAAEL